MQNYLLSQIHNKNTKNLFDLFEDARLYKANFFYLSNILIKLPFGFEREPLMVFY